MKKLWLLGLLLCSWVGKSQIESALAEEMRANPEAFYKVAISFYTQSDLPQFAEELEAKKVPVAERPRLVNRLLMQEANASQTEALQLIEQSNQELLRTVQSFYIVNLIYLEAKPELIRQIASLNEVERIFSAQSELALIEPIVTESTPRAKSSSSGTEAGLIAIKAPAMWNLGYTGRGRTVYVYDTGVWPEHPSFSERFLGHYRPLSQSWYGHFNSEATGVINNHGTHVLGTVAGLDAQTQDTIGVAFESYWMACDLINASTAAALPPMVHLIAGFQWALNPDGDTATSHDVPDVINNSWRWRDNPDTVECGGFVVQLMNAIEAAGMANVFAGGNFGPNNTWVNSPQRINTSEVNTFSVGSVDGNQSFPYPISNFSSRGPTQCPGSGSLKIHPQVVAPGQNVRSAWGTDGYNTISGTSMAAPHVSGAVLLLKEAFPQLSGAQLLTALYQSAIDMGPTGEDNTYGRGLIDVYAAYQLLSASNTPSNPNAVAWDIAVRNFSAPNYAPYHCQLTLDPYLILENLGDSTITSLAVDMYENGSLMAATGQWLYANLNLAPGQIDTLLLNSQSIGNFGLGEQVYEVRVRIPNRTELDSINNRRFMRFHTAAGIAIFPYTEDFEQGPKMEWYEVNEDRGMGWELDSTLGWPGNQQHMRLPYADYTPRENQKDALWLGMVEIPQDSNFRLSFDLAYQQYVPIRAVQDTFRVWLNRSCTHDPTQAELLLELAGSDLATVNSTGPFFSPQSKDDWRREHISLADYAGEHVLLSFEGTNRNGNNLHLDNLAIYKGPDPLGQSEFKALSFAVYPNPSDGQFWLKAEGESALNWQLTDLSGRIIQAGQLPKVGGMLTLPDVQAGLYTLKLEQDRQRFSEAILIQ